MLLYDIVDIFKVHANCVQILCSPNIYLKFIISHQGWARATRYQSNITVASEQFLAFHRRSLSCLLQGFIPDVSSLVPSSKI
jgi:hypothetical protein